MHTYTLLLKPHLSPPHTEHWISPSCTMYNVYITRKFLVRLPFPMCEERALLTWELRLETQDVLHSTLYTLDSRLQTQDGRDEWVSRETGNFPTFPFSILSHSIFKTRFSQSYGKFKDYYSEVCIHNSKPKTQTEPWRFKDFWWHLILIQKPKKRNNE